MKLISFQLKNVTNVLKNTEEYASMDVNNFGAFAIVLQKPIASSLKTVYEALVQRYERENKQMRYICLENNEVICMHYLSREREREIHHDLFTCAPIRKHSSRVDKQLLLLLKRPSFVFFYFLVVNN